MRLLRSLFGIVILVVGCLMILVFVGAWVGEWMSGKPTVLSAQPATTAVSTPTMVATLTASAPMTPTMLAPTTPTPVAGEPTVIRFDRGTYGKTFTDSTAGPKSYLLWARKGQQISILLKTSGAALTSLYLQETGAFLYDKAAQGSTVTGTLPSDGNYILVVFPGDAKATTFELSVFIR